MLLRPDKIQWKPSLLESRFLMMLLWSRTAYRYNASSLKIYFDFF
jgi:hypothetical protein